MEGLGSILTHSYKDSRFQFSSSQFELLVLEAIRTSKNMYKKLMPKHLTGSSHGCHETVGSVHFTKVNHWTVDFMYLLQEWYHLKSYYPLLTKIIKEKNYFLSGVCSNRRRKCLFCIKARSPVLPQQNSGVLSGFQKIPKKCQF